MRAPDLNTKGDYTNTKDIYKVDTKYQSLLLTYDIVICIIAGTSLDKCDMTRERIVSGHVEQEDK